MTSTHVQTEINAPPEVVWRVLTETLPRRPEPFGILRLEGDIAPDGRIKLWSEVSPNRAFALRVAEFTPPRRMVWRGGMPLGLFTGTRTFTVAPTPTGSRFEMEEVFTGPLSGMVTRSMPDLTPSFKTIANALKTEAESHD